MICSHFEEALRITPDGDGFRRGVIRVADTMRLCSCWLADNYPETHNASDVIAMAAIVMAEMVRGKAGRMTRPTDPTYMIERLETKWLSAEEMRDCATMLRTLAAERDAALERLDLQTAVPQTNDDRTGPV